MKSREKSALEWNFRVCNGSRCEGLEMSVKEIRLKMERIGVKLELAYAFPLYKIKDKIRTKY